MPQPLRHALVTGASTGLGLETALTLARAGYDVALADIRADMLDEAMRHPDLTGVKSAAVTLDLLSEQSMRDGFSAATGHFVGGPRLRLSGPRAPCPSRSPRRARPGCARTSRRAPCAVERRHGVCAHCAPLLGVGGGAAPRARRGAARDGRPTPRPPRPATGTAPRPGHLRPQRATAVWADTHRHAATRDDTVTDERVLSVLPC